MQVMIHFSDNYDYQDIRKNYLTNEVQVRNVWEWLD